MFDDRIEIRSPGLPPNPVTVAALNRRKHIHLSRNPLIVRVLAELGYMRELGEGIPRIFAEIEQEGFYPPRFDDSGGVSFQLTLRNQPVYDSETVKWLGRFNNPGLTGDQNRLLVYARVHDNRFTSREYQKLAGLDIFGASTSIKDFIRLGVARSLRMGSRIYQLTDSPIEEVAAPPELGQLFGLLKEKGAIKNSDVQVALKLERKAASRLPEKLVRENCLTRIGQRRGTRYTPGPRAYETPPL